MIDFSGQVAITRGRTVVIPAAGTAIGRICAQLHNDDNVSERI